MYPFWRDVVAPIIQAADARRIVEVGALLGQSTQLMLDEMGPDVEVHVVDPKPMFDPTEHERRFAGRYVFHRDLSVNVLGALPPMDVALLDGDHNWYTVFTELNLLAGVARQAGAPLPVVILHDVGWPYGRRDLYYDPATIPEEHRQPWRRAGLRRDNERLMPAGRGLNAELAHAEQEGGPRNGVMTAVEDFVGQHDRPLRLVTVPALFGLSVLVEEERLAARPAIAAELDWLESAEGRERLLRLVEDFRLDALVYEQFLLRTASDQVETLSRRYLDAVKELIVDATDGGVRAGLDLLHGEMDSLRAHFVQGDAAVIAPASDALGAFLVAYLATWDAAPSARRVLIADPRAAGEASGRPNRGLLRRLALPSETTCFVGGEGGAIVEALGEAQLALVHLGSLDGPALRGLLEDLQPRLAHGATLLIEDPDDPVVADAIERFCKQRAAAGNAQPPDIEHHPGFAAIHLR